MLIENWGQMEYVLAQEKQIQYVEEIAKGDREDTLVLCSHDPVVTMGRGTKPGDLFAWNGATYESSRGGRATYHGPNQLVIYPLLNLKKQRKNFKTNDIHAYLRELEKAIVASLKHFDIQAEVRNIQMEAGPSLTGVWVPEENGPDKKIASIGVAIKKGVTYHGVAINVDEDPLAFQGIHPCGFKSEIMTTMEAVLNKKVLRQDFHDVCVRLFQKHLS